MIDFPIFQKKSNQFTLTWRGGSVEIWDLSGDPVFLPNWPSVTPDAHAVIYVCPEDGNTSDLDTW